ncbi:MAG: DedA family protein [Deltaproteobacteria bacterium]|nr:MAG: DedA family protein [Deltaproteobacteria bacterium]
MHEFLVANGYPALFLLSFLASTLIPLGSEWLLVTLIVQGFAPLPVVLVASAGNLMGACTSYGIGVCGSTFLTTRILRMGDRERVRAERFFAKYGIWSLLLSWLPVIGDPLCVVAGMMKLGFGRFALLVATGKVVRYAAVAWAALEGRQLFYF